MHRCTVYPPAMVSPCQAPPERSFGSRCTRSSAPATWPRLAKPSPGSDRRTVPRMARWRVNGWWMLDESVDGLMVEGEWMLHELMIVMLMDDE